MSLSRGLFSQFEVVHALVLRETRTRFGAHRLGYLWAVLEPLSMILTFYILLSIVHRQAPRGMDQFSFLCTGMVPYVLFANSVNRVADAINSNKALLFYPHVQPLDLVIARCVLELTTYACVFVILMGGHVLHIQRLEVADPLILITGFLLASLIGTSLGLVFCGLGQFSNAVDRARGPLLRPFFWISGIFFTADTMPEAARHAVLYNPLLHAVEFVRAGWFKSYGAHHVSLTYPLAWILGLTIIGLSLERVVRRRIELT